MSAVLLLSALLMGLLGSAHCVAMCGGVVAMSCSAMPLARRGRVLSQLPYVLTYNLGRIVSYAVAGAIAGTLGRTLASVGAIEHVQLGLRLLAGLMMIAVGIYVAGFAASLSWMERLGEPVWRRILPFARRLVPVRSPLSALALGTLWGWLPCGLVYAALAASVTAGSAITGAATMAAFGLGTLPALVALGSAAAAVARAAGHAWVRRAAGALLVAFGALNATHVAQAWGAHERPTCCAHAHVH